MNKPRLQLFEFPYEYPMNIFDSYFKNEVFTG